jgi:hypothetical protein
VVGLNVSGLATEADGFPYVDAALTAHWAAMDALSEDADDPEQDRRAWLWPICWPGTLPLDDQISYLPGAPTSPADEDWGAPMGRSGLVWFPDRGHGRAGCHGALPAQQVPARTDPERGVVAGCARVTL